MSDNESSGSEGAAENEDEGVFVIPENPVAALAESKEAFGILLDWKLAIFTSEAEQGIQNFAQAIIDKVDEATRAEEAGERVQATNLYLEAENLRQRWRACITEKANQEEAASNSWLDELFQRITQLEEYTGLSPDPNLRYEGLRILVWVSPKLRLSIDDSFRVRDFFHRDLEDAEHNMAFLDDSPDR